MKIISLFKNWLVILEAKALTLPNPIGSENMTLEDVVLNVIRFILGIVSIVAVIQFIVGGLTILTSQGNPEKVKKGKDTLIWAIIGIALIFGSYMILSQIFEIFKSATAPTE